MALIKTIEELQEYARIPGNISGTSFLPSVPDAQDKYLPQLLGDELLNNLDTWYNLTTRPNLAAYEKLLPYVQRVLARFTLFIASPEVDVTITDTGIGVINSGNIAPASSDRVKKYDEANKERAWANAETLLKFLEKNKADYPEWVSSQAYTMAISNMVNTCLEFNSIYNIDDSRRTFYDLRGFQDDVDNLYIKPVISAELFDRIITEMKAENISVPIKKILAPLKRAEVYFTVLEIISTKYVGDNWRLAAELLPRDIENYTNKAKTYIAEARAIIDKTPTDYPEYMASDCFDDTGAPNLYQNTKAAPNFHFRWKN